MNLNFLKLGNRHVYHGDKKAVIALRNIPAKRLMLTKVLAVLKTVDVPGESQAQKKQFFSKHDPFFMTDQRIEEIYNSLKKTFK